MVKKYVEYIQERLGISDPASIYAGIVFTYIKSTFEEIYKNDEENQKLEILLNDRFLKRNMNPKDKMICKELPISKFFIVFRLIKNESNNEYGNKSATSGNCYEFTNLNDEISFKSKKSGITIDRNGDTSIQARIDLTLDIGTNFMDRNLEMFYVELDSLILHELNHFNESYNRVSKELDLNKDIDAYIGVVDVKNPNPGFISSELFKLWKDFTFLLYYSEPHETNAIVQETLPYIKKGVPLDKIPGWGIQLKLNSFNKDLFIKEMLKLANGNKSKLELLKNIFAEKFKSLLVSQGKFINNVYHTKHDMNFMMSSSFEQFVSEYGKIILKQGDRLRRNILRLYSY
jgi:hypothetical protein